LTATKIEWAEETWNPTVGCSKVSPGCDGCYAIGVAHRAMQPAHEGLTIKRAGERTDWTGEVRCLPERLEVPLRRRRPTTFFVDSMSDLFHPAVPLPFLNQVVVTMANAPQHTFQVLTKRPQRMEKYFRALHVASPAWLRAMPNVWLGTSIESDRYAFRADHLRATPAAVRFLSLEPLLGPLPSLDLAGIDWVITGGESGPGARPMHPDWVRDVRDRCAAAGVAFFFKQWGGWVPYEHDAQPPFLASQHGDLFDGHYLPADLSDHRETRGWLWPGDINDGQLDTTLFRRVGKKVAGRELDGRMWDEMPSRTEVNA
jgi:protein gp37